MAIGATAVWRVRTGGNAANGGAYDPAITGGTDYSQQDAAQITCTSTLSTSAANSTALLNSGNTFTSAMVGNCIQISAGTNFIAGFYFITAFTSSGNVTLDRTPTTAGAGASGTGRVGGAHASISTANSAQVAGNTIYFRNRQGSGNDWVQTTAGGAITSSGTSLTVASASGFPSSGTYQIGIGTEILTVSSGAGTTTWTVTRGQFSSTAAAHSSGDLVTLIDYPNDSSFAPNGGDSTSGYVFYKPETGTRACFSPNGRLFQDGGAYVSYEGVMLYARAGVSGIGWLMAGGYGIIKDCSVIANQLGYQGAIFAYGGSVMVINCDVWGGYPNGSPPAVDTSGTQTGIYMNRSGYVLNCFVRGVSGDGIRTGQQCCTVRDCVVARASGHGLNVSWGNDNQFFTSIVYNTIDNCGGDGIRLGDGDFSQSPGEVHSNIVSNCTQSGATALNVVNLTTTLNDKLKRLIGPNFFYNNTATYARISANAADVAGTDPQYVSNAVGRFPDYRIGTNLANLAYPTSIRGMTPATYSDPGALQRQPPPLRRPSLIGVG